MQNILDQIDDYYLKNQYDEAYQYMIQQLEKALQHNQDDIVLGLLSELMGYYRVRGLFDLGNQMASHAKKIIQSLALEDSLAGATTYLNIATLYRVQGLYKESFDEYQKSLSIYQKQLDETDERYISLYNNMSLLYQELNQFDQALDYELKALSLIENKKDCEQEKAITYTNLSQMYFQINQIEKGEEYLNQAIDLFQQYAPFDPHYFAAMASLAQSYYMKHDYHQALKIYEDVLIKIEKTFGKNKDYETVYSNYQYVKQMIGSGMGLSLSEEYFYDVGLPMLQEKFSHLLKYMAVGLVGMGSECLGYDDQYSQDHDFGPGFCIWLPSDIYKQHASEIQQSYNQLNPTYKGYKRDISANGDNRIGVFDIDNFYIMHLGLIPTNLKDWLRVDEQALLMMTSGKVFIDNLGEFSKVRKSLSYYPEDIRIKKIAMAIAKMAQSGQYNYARCMKRYDEVAAQLALYEFINETFSCLYLLNKKYKPYYKWVYRKSMELEIGKEVIEMLKQLTLMNSQIQQWHVDSSSLNLLDKKVELIEKICTRIILELKRQHLTQQDDQFLECHVHDVMSKIVDKEIRQMHVMEG